MIDIKLNKNKFLSGYNNIESNKKKYKINFLVTSHKNYYKETLSILLNSMIVQIPVERIIIVIGGYEEKQLFKDYYGMELNLVDYNCYDHTGFVHLAENWDRYKNNFDYFFNLHDTCQTGPYFSELVYNFPDGINTYAVWNKSSSNLGLYKNLYFETKITEILHNKKIFLKDGKDASIRLEDTLWTHPKSNNKPSYNHSDSIENIGMGDKLIQVAGDPVGYKIPYRNSKLKRRAICYRKLNLYKFKSRGVAAQGI